jgi:hypothetical protein
MQVVADYLDPITNQRTLLLERIEGGVGSSAPAVAKPIVRRKRKARAAVAQPTNAGSQTAFPGGETANG